METTDGKAETVDAADVLRLENLQLKLLLAAYKEKGLMEEVARVRNERQQFQQSMAALHVELAAKYSFDPNKQVIDVATGTIRDVQQMTPAGLQDLMLAIASKRQS